MSNIYIQEPPTSGKVLLRTSVGDIDVELWAKETPKASRNFVQLCLEGYYDGTIFHRLVKGFIVQGGDPTGTGEGGESVYGAPFKDEFHSRLRFSRRGLLAMANAGKDDNGSQFFFTLAAAPELQNKHTIFGKVVGDTLYNMLKLAEGLTDKDERPLYPHKLLSTEVLTNPFPDIEPRALPKPAAAPAPEGTSRKKDKRAAVKNFKLLSFGEEAEEDEEVSAEVSRRLASGRSGGKSAHDMLQVPELSSTPAVAPEDTTLSGDEDDDVIGPTVDADLVRDKLKRRSSDSEAPRDRKAKKQKPSPEKPPEKAAEEEGNSGSDSEEDFQAKQLKRLRQEYNELRAQLRAERRQKGAQQDKDSDDNSADGAATLSEALKEFQATREKYRSMRDQVPKKGASREDFTLQLLARFQQRLHSAKDSAQQDEDKDKPSTSTDKAKAGEEEEDDDASWLTHRLEFEKGGAVLAKDASTKDDDWFEIYDPRNPINKRRREAARDKERGEGGRAEGGRGGSPRRHDHRSSDHRHRHRR